jgi:hypothetical protein
MNRNITFSLTPFLFCPLADDGFGPSPGSGSASRFLGFRFLDPVFSIFLLSGRYSQGTPIAGGVSHKTGGLSNRRGVPGEEIFQQNGVMGSLNFEQRTSRLIAD